MRLPWQQAPASLQPINTSEECVWQMLECYLWYGCSRGTSNRQRRRKKTTRDAPTVPHQGDDSEASREGEAERLQMGSKRWGSRKAGRQRRGEVGREQQGTEGGGKRKEGTEKEQGEGDEYQGKS